MARPESYTKTVWSPGDVVDAADLDKIEAGLYTLVDEWQDHIDGTLDDHKLEDLSDAGVGVDSPSDGDTLFWFPTWNNDFRADQPGASYPTGCRPTDHTVAAHDDDKLRLDGADSMLNNPRLGENYVADYGTVTGSGTQMIFWLDEWWRKQSSGDRYKADWREIPVELAWRVVDAAGWIFRYNRKAAGVGPGPHPLHAGLRATLIAGNLTREEAELFVTFDDQGRADALISGAVLAALVVVFNDLRRHLELVEV